MKKQTVTVTVTVTLRNTFHHTERNVRVPATWGTDPADVFSLIQCYGGDRARRVEKSLCPSGGLSGGCCCGILRQR